MLGDAEGGCKGQGGEATEPNSPTPTE